MWLAPLVLTSLSVTALPSGSAGASSKQSSMPTTLTASGASASTDAPVFNAVASAESSSLKSKLLRLTQLPSGWAVFTNNGSPQCTSPRYEKGLHQEQGANATFTNDGATFRLCEHVAPFSQRTTKVFGEVVSAIKVYRLPPHVRLLRFGRIAFPKFGQRSVAFGASYEIPGVAHGRRPVHWDVVVVSIGTLLVWIMEWGAPAEVTQLSPIVQTALADAGWRAGGSRVPS